MKCKIKLVAAIRQHCHSPMAHLGRAGGGGWDRGVLAGLDCAASRVTFRGPVLKVDWAERLDAALAAAFAIFYESGLWRSVCY